MPPGHSRHLIDRQRPRLRGEDSLRRQCPTMSLRCAWQTPSIRTVRTAVRPNVFRSTPLRSSVPCAPSDSLAPTTCVRIYGPIPTSDRSCVPYVAKPLRDSMTVSDTRVCTRVRRSSSARVISRSVANGDVDGGSPVLTLSVVISGLRLVVSVSSLCWMKR